MSKKNPKGPETTLEALESAISQRQADGKRMSIRAVALMANVDPSLIHHCYPGVLAKINALKGAGLRRTVDVVHEDLAASKQGQRDLEAENRALRADLAKLASINLSLSSRLEAVERSNK